MKADVGQKWVEALRSGEFKQGHGALASQLEDGPVKYCCLGLLCELAVRDGVDVKREKRPMSSLVRFDGERNYLPASVRLWAGLSEGNPTAVNNGGVAKGLAVMNDAGYTFKQIADIIEKNVEVL